MISSLQFDAVRVKKALRQEGRKRQLERDKVDQVFTAMMSTVAICGEFSQNRVMALRIGTALLNGSTTVLCPVCVDYGDDIAQRAYATKAFVSKHIAFLVQLREIMPSLAPVFLVPDHEAENPELCQVCRVSSVELAETLSFVASNTRQLVGEQGWQTRMMSEFIPDLETLEAEAWQRILVNPGLASKLETHMLHRAPLYQRIHPGMPPADMKLRTAQTAGQILVLGRLASQQQMLICSHSTTSLRWYMETQAPVLHNPTKDQRISRPDGW